MSELGTLTNFEKELIVVIRKSQQLDREVLQKIESRIEQLVQEQIMNVRQQIQQLLVQQQQLQQHQQHSQTIGTKPTTVETASKPKGGTQQPQTQKQPQLEQHQNQKEKHARPQNQPKLSKKQGSNNSESTNELDHQPQQEKHQVTDPHLMLLSEPLLPEGDKIDLHDDVIKMMGPKPGDNGSKKGIQANNPQTPERKSKRSNNHKIQDEEKLEDGETSKANITPSSSHHHGVQPSSPNHFVGESCNKANPVPSPANSQREQRESKRKAVASLAAVCEDANQFEKEQKRQKN